MPDGRKYENWEIVTFMNDSLKDYFLYEGYILKYCGTQTEIKIAYTVENIINSLSISYEMWECLEIYKRRKQRYVELNYMNWSFYWDTLSEALNKLSDYLKKTN